MIVLMFLFISLSQGEKRGEAKRQPRNRVALFSTSILAGGDNCLLCTVPAFRRVLRLCLAQRLAQRTTDEANHEHEVKTLR